METDFNFIKWIFENCIIDAKFNCVEYNSKIYDLDFIGDQKKLYSDYLKTL